MEKAKKNIKEYKKTTSIVVKNLTEVIEATSLAIVAGYAIWSAIYQHNLERIEDHILLTAGSVVSLIAFSLYIKHLRKN